MITPSSVNSVRSFKGPGTHEKRSAYQSAAKLPSSNHMLPHCGADKPGSPQRSVELSARDFDMHICSHYQAAINSPETLAMRRAVSFDQRKRTETAADSSDSDLQ